jgi:hypothetical protein
MKSQRFIPFCGYPVRPNPQQGESLAGYCCRYLASNGYAMSAPLLAQLAQLYRDKTESVVNHLDTLQAILADKILIDREFWLEHPVITRKHEKIGHDLRINHVYFCPLCLQEKKFHFAFWELPLADACPEHQCKLLPGCPACDEAFTWTRILPGWLCPCKTPIKTMPTHYAALEAMTLARIIANARDVALPENFGTRFIDTTSGQYELGEIYDLLDGACRFLVTPQNETAR